MIRDGIYYGLGFAAGGLLVLWFAGPWPALPFFLMGAFCAWFFRDPERPIPVGPVALSPADGRVVAVVPEADRCTRISIFLNIFDVHVNRSPISGVITDVTYQRGQFLVASRPVASLENEQNIITVRAEERDESSVQTNRGIDSAPYRLHQENRRFRAGRRTRWFHQVRLASRCHFRSGVARRGFSRIARYGGFERSCQPRRQHRTGAAARRQY